MYNKNIEKKVDKIKFFWYNYFRKKKGEFTMALSNKELKTRLRKKYFTMLKDLLSQTDEEILVIGDATLCFPTLNENGEEEFVKIVLSVPTGSKDEVFDGYSLKEDYDLKQKLNKEKTLKKEELKRKKQEQDAKLRAKKKELQKQRGL